MLSLFHTPVVHTDKGPGGNNVPVVSSMIFFSVDRASSFSKARVASSPLDGWACKRIRLANTASVKIRSPTMIRLRSRMGEGREEKYERMAVMHEYAGLNDSWNRTGARR